MKLPLIKGFFGLSASQNGNKRRSGSRAGTPSDVDSSRDEGGRDSPISGKPRVRAGSKMTSGQIEGGLTQIEPSDLEESMLQAAGNVLPWETGSFVSVRRLQEAIRNHGFVDMMRMPEEAGGQEVAVKRMPTSWVMHGPQEFRKHYPQTPERPWYDIGIVRELNNLKFPNVCDLFGVYRDREHTYVVTALATEGDLFGWCEREPRPGKTREALMNPLTLQIFSAVRWLHDLGVAHRDLSLENILLTDLGGGEMQIKIIDFGMCTLSRTCRGEVRGKQSYQAPEMHLDAEYSAFLVDEFAIGVTMFAMAAQDYPWTSTKPNTCQLHEFVGTFGLRKFLEKRKLRKGSGEYLIQVFSPALVEVLDGLLQRQPSSRYSFGESCQSERISVWDTVWVVESG